MKLSVFDLFGREVAVLVNEKKEAGRYEGTWDARLRFANFGGQASSMASGVYFYKLMAGSPSAGSGQVYVETRRMLLLK